MTVNPPSRRGGAGFTLIELMVSLVLALLVAAAMGSIYLGSTQSYRTGTGLTQVQEEGRFSSLLVAPIIRQAGYVADPLLTQSDPATIFLSAQNQNAITGFDNSAPSTTVYKSFPSTTQAGTDAIAVAFVGTSDSPLRTCLGAQVPNLSLAVNIFYISPADASGVSSLSCYTNVVAFTGNVPGALSTGTATSQPLIPGVTDMQILYGIDANGDGSAISYYTAAQIGASGFKPSGATNPVLTTNPWLAVTQVQITYTILSTDPVEIFKKSTGTTTNGIDANGRLRRTFVNTIDVRNLLHN